MDVAVFVVTIAAALCKPMADALFHREMEEHVVGLAVKVTEKLVGVFYMLGDVHDVDVVYAVRYVCAADFKAYVRVLVALGGDLDSIAGYVVAD